METWKRGDINMRHGNMETWTWRHSNRVKILGNTDVFFYKKIKRTTEAQMIFLVFIIPYTVCSSCK
jgi:hypothetical protein